MSRGLSVFGASIREAGDSLRKTKLRTALGMIGIMIGISSVITMISLGEIAKNQAIKEFEALGTDMVIIRESFDSASRSNNVRLLKLEDTLMLQHQVAEISVAATRVLNHGDFRYSGRQVGTGDIQGVTESFADLGQFVLASGRFVSDLDTDRYYATVGSDIVDSMLEAGVVDIVGENIEISDTVFTVVGALDRLEESYRLPVSFNANSSVFIPVTTSGRLFGNFEIDTVIARSKDGIHHEAVTESIEAYFRGRSHDISLNIITAKDLIAQMEAQAQIYTLLLAAIGSISLVVGGIGIMNILLVSVVERRKEIGIRRALGARRRDIQVQFLIESILQTATGGVLGVLLGMVTTYAICRFTGWDFAVSTVSIMSGVGSAIIMGLVFGIQPANQAARLDPIIALQTE